MKLMEIYRGLLEVNVIFELDRRRFEFPDGYIMPNGNITLYRVLALDVDRTTKKPTYEIDNGFGVHYVSRKKTLDDRSWQYEIGIDQLLTDNPKLELFGFEVSVNSDDVDIESTIDHGIAYPDEFEYTLFKGSKVKVLNWWKLNVDDDGDL